MIDSEMEKREVKTEETVDKSASIRFYLKVEVTCEVSIRQVDPARPRNTYDEYVSRFCPDTV